MRDYIVQSSMNEKHPEKVDIFDTCVKLGDLDTESYWCYLKNKVATDLFSEEDEEEVVGVFKKSQLGYKLADQRVPYPTEKELEEVIIKSFATSEPANKPEHTLEIKLTDLHKTKWQLLAEAYINGK